MPTNLPYLALSCVGFIATAPAFAEAPATPQSRVADRDDVVVNGTKDVPPPQVESPKATSAILDTPQTITVVSDQVIRKQNLQTLRDVLQTIPGITFGAGEGGGGYGDSINLRGYSASNDITQDGVRDSAQYSRTDPFNLQQIEVYNGANSVFNGSGSVGGTINLVSKVPTPETLTIVQGSVGTDEYYRGAIDSNVRASDLIAVRLNAAYHRNDVPGRDVEKFKRWGVAPAVTIGIDSPTSLTLAYVHQEDENTPIYGVPYFKSGVADGVLPGVDRSDYYGIVNLDRQEQTVDRLTATFRHQVSDQISVRNLTRWQRVGQYSQTSAPQGTFCLANGLQPLGADGAATTGIACNATVTNVSINDGPLQTVTVPVPPGFFQPSGPRGLVRDQENQLLTNQTDLRIESGERDGNFHNTLNVGVQGAIEDYAITTASLPRNAAGAPVLLPQISLSNPDTTYTGPINYTITAQSKAETRNLAVYAFDTLEIGRYFEINGGVRWEYNRGTFRALPLQFVPPGTAPLTDLLRTSQTSREKLFSYRIGGVFHPVQDVSIYAGYGNAKTPSSATVRLGCGVPTVPGGADPCATAPESARNYEAGVKAGVFGRRLELTAAVFRNERSNFRVPSNDPSLPAGLQVLDGKSRVDGIALGVSGAVTPAWTIFANYTYLDGSVRQSISNRDRAAGVFDAQAGQDLLQTPNHSGSLFTTYKLPFGLEVGYGLTYQGSFALNNRVRVVTTTTTIDTPQYRADDYLIHRAYVAYTFGGGLTAQLNIQNFTDEKYVTGIRNNVSTTGANNGAITGGWATPGDRRSAVLSLFYSF
ncbi:TonB-dependent receptor [Sphingomonas sp. SUN019]|uniref:TonB-dependent receptor n=1 Tax=Sphingomonas sp. SUN019 TaxID=2937788 RepID=UPI0021647383|nr:TonB-dependent receptor [Sphingomonas sp. SUN019]UVO49645.1 TonB-dependent receptor [Sphingomonas sp. SUN019]